jgi:hypothetical protein
MIKQMFTVYDEKSEAYLQPFFLDTTGQALRAISDCLIDDNHQFARHPADYTLFQLGTYDDSTGVIVNDKKMLHPLLELKGDNES